MHAPNLISSYIYQGRLYSQPKGFTDLAKKQKLYLIFQFFFFVLTPKIKFGHPNPKFFFLSQLK